MRERDVRRLVAGMSSALRTSGRWRSCASVAEIETRLYGISGRACRCGCTVSSMLSGPGCGRRRRGRLPPRRQARSGRAARRVERRVARHLVRHRRRRTGATRRPASSQRRRPRRCSAAKRRDTVASRLCSSCDPESKRRKLCGKVVAMMRCVNCQIARFSYLAQPLADAHVDFVTRRTRAPVNLAACGVRSRLESARHSANAAAGTPRVERFGSGSTEGSVPMTAAGRTDGRAAPRRRGNPAREPICGESSRAASRCASRRVSIRRRPICISATPC